MSNLLYDLHPLPQSLVAFAAPGKQPQLLDATFLELRPTTSIDLCDSQVDTDNFAKTQTPRIRLRKGRKARRALTKSIGTECSFGITFPKGKKRRCAFSAIPTEIDGTNTVKLSLTSAVLWY